MRKINKILILVILITVILVQSYCVIASSWNSDNLDFKVRFSGEPTVSNENKVKASITNDLNATVNVTGLTMEENIETATFIIQNTSKDLSAEISLNVSNNNEEYFLIKSEVEKTTLIKGEATKVTVKIELIKEPVEKSEKATIGIQLDVKAIQPTENNSENQQDTSSSSSTKNPSITSNNNYVGYYEKDKTPKTGTFKFMDILER